MMFDRSYLLHFLVLMGITEQGIIWAFRPALLPPFPITSTSNHLPVLRPFALSPLGMGRAAAVRAATKAKTDMKKAKTNALFGKKIIMAVKEGGSPDPNANRKLADIIKQAKANSVPVDNINRASKWDTGRYA